jgi:2-oxoglutarate ferredoxin oxidoreductase subunit beta
MTHPEFPEPMGVFYQIEDDCYENLLQKQVDDAIAAKGKPDLQALFNSGDIFEVK